jgi:hypothetical protein
LRAPKKGCCRTEVEAVTPCTRDCCCRTAKASCCLLQFTMSVVCFLNEPCWLPAVYRRGACFVHTPCKWFESAHSPVPAHCPHVKCCGVRGLCAPGVCVNE